MKVTILKLNTALPALNAMANTKLPSRIAYRIGKTLNVISSAIKGTEDYRINTLNSMATLNEDKTKYIFEPPEKEDEFNAMFGEYKQREVEVQFPLFTLAELGNIQIEPAVMGMLDEIGAISDLELVETPVKLQ